MRRSRSTRTPATSRMPWACACTPMGPRSTIMNACSSSLLAIGQAWEQLAAGDLDLAVAGGAEALCRMTFAGFSSLKALDTQPMPPLQPGPGGPEPGRRLRSADPGAPDAGQGQGSATILGEVLGYGASMDAHHPTAPHPEGEGAARAIGMALRLSGLYAEEVDLVSAHATATPGQRWRRVPGHQAGPGGGGRRRSPSRPPRASSATPSGAAGAVGAATAVLCLRDQVVSPTLRLVDPDPAVRPGLHPAGGQGAQAPRRPGERLRLRRQQRLPGPQALGGTVRQELVITGMGLVLPCGTGIEAARAPGSPACPVSRPCRRPWARVWGPPAPPSTPPGSSRPCRAAAWTGPRASPGWPPTRPSRTRAWSPAHWACASGVAVGTMTGGDEATEAFLRPYLGEGTRGGLAHALPQLRGRGHQRLPLHGLRAPGAQCHPAGPGGQHPGGPGAGPALAAGWASWRPSWSWAPTASSRCCRSSCSARASRSARGCPRWVPGGASCPAKAPRPSSWRPGIRRGPGRQDPRRAAGRGGAGSGDRATGRAQPGAGGDGGLHHPFRARCLDRRQLRPPHAGRGGGAPAGPCSSAGPNPKFPKTLWGEFCGSGGQLLAAALLEPGRRVLVTAPSSFGAQYAAVLEKP